MRQADLAAPGTDADGFDMTTSSADGTGRGIALDDAAIVWNSGKQRRRRTFDDIVSIELEATQEAELYARCDIRFADGAHLTVYLDDTRADGSLVYREFVNRFFRRLGPERRRRISFVQGYRPATRIMLVAGAILGMIFCLGVLLYAFTAPDPGDPGWWVMWLLMVGIFAGFAIGFRQALNKAQTTFDPDAVPEQALPLAPRPRRK